MPLPRERADPFMLPRERCRRHVPSITVTSDPHFLLFSGHRRAMYNNTRFYKAQGRGVTAVALRTAPYERPIRSTFCGGCIIVNEASHSALT